MGQARFWVLSLIETKMDDLETLTTQETPFHLCQGKVSKPGQGHCCLVASRVCLSPSYPWPAQPDFPLPEKAGAHAPGYTLSSGQYLL